MLKSLKSIISTLGVVSRKFTSVFRTGSNMDKVCVRSVEGDERIHISLFYERQGKPSPREINVDRPKTEDLSKTFERLGINLTKKCLGNKKRKSLSSGNVASMCLTQSNSEQVDENTPNNRAWSNGSILGINFDEKFLEYEVVLNPPTIRLLKLPACLLSGFTVQPEVDGEFIDLSVCVFKWYRLTPHTENEEDVAAAHVQTTKKRKISQIEDKEEHICDGPFYVIHNSDIGSKLKLVCIPANSETTGREVEVISKSEVTAGPGTTPFEARHFLTEALTSDDSLRLVSYNILADIYADSDFSRDVLFPYCPHYALSMDYRKHLLVKEIAGYNADIVCLQEVDKKVFRNDLLPALTNCGYDGVLKVKSDAVREGTATFVRSEKFRIIQQHDIVLKEELSQNQVHKELWEKISKNENMKSTMERTTLLQVTVVECVKQPHKYVVVGNTHLYFHPKANNVRLLQTFLCLHHLDHVKSIHQQQGKEATVVFCGDLNSVPLSGAVELIKTGSIPSHHSDWFSGGKPQQLENIELRQNLGLMSACGYPAYTNYTAGFQNCLDYIFIEQQKLSVERVIPLPSHEEVTQFTAIPNPVFPSDHLALVCDLQWVKDTL